MDMHNREALQLNGSFLDRGGDSNTTNGNYGTVPGGYQNHALGIDNAARALRFYSPNNSGTYASAHFSSFQARMQTANIVYTLPTSMPLAGEVLTATPGTAPNVLLSWDSVTGAGSSANFWKITGNSAVPPPTNYLGTQDSEAFEIHIHNNTLDTTGGNQRVMRYSEGPTSPNILGGSSANQLGTALSGAAILSGGSLASPNIERDSFAAIMGGNGNIIDTAGAFSSIAGGRHNYVNGPFSVIAGGESNTIVMDSADHNSIGGGLSNTEYDPSFGVIAGGAYNYLGFDSWSSAVAGGWYDTVLSSRSFLGAGEQNMIDSESTLSAIVGGQRNLTANGANYAFVGAGVQNGVHAQSSVIVGGDSNTVWSLYSTLGGGVHNTLWGVSGYSFLGGGAYNGAQDSFQVVVGGYHNNIDSASEYSSILGGSTNYIARFTPYSLLGGGADDTILSPESSIGGGVVNKINQGSGQSVLVGGGFNLIDTSAPLSFIGGGCNHRIYGDSNGAIVGGCGNTVNGYAGFIGAGADNHIYASAAAIGGGQLNNVHASNASIGSGYSNTVMSGGLAAAIPGGDHLTAQSYAQTVIGFYNVPSGSAIDTSSRLTNRDNFLLIAGNGGNVGGKIVQSDAFDVTYGGHSIVHDMDSSNASLTNNSKNGRFPTYGGRYLDNTTVAEGDVVPMPTDTPTILDIPLRANADFGVYRILHPHVGEFIILIRTTDANSNSVTFDNGFITATLKDADGNIGDSAISPPGCGTITATNLYSPYVMPAPYNTYFLPTWYSAWFIIRTSEASGCTPWDRPFYFKVCARPF